MTDPITWSEARDRVLRAAPLGVSAVETVPLADCLGRVLAHDVRSDVPWPTTDRSAMDGFALGTGGAGAEAGAVFRVVGTALAGHPLERALGPGEAARIMTGGVVPEGADTVVPVEDTSGFEGETVTVRAAVRPGANVRPRGSEVAVGDVLVGGAARLTAAEVGALAVLGVVEVDVARRPRVAILSTGDEVVDVTATPALHQVRDSNSWTLAAKVAELGGVAERLGIVADDPGILRRALERGLASDVLVTIGGVSKGTHDLVHGTLRELGVEAVFHGVALKPGKPTFFGVRKAPGGAGGFVFGLPGNPASAATTFDLFVAPLLQRLCGREPPAPLEVRRAGVPFRRNRRAQIVPATLAVDADGVLAARLRALRPSGDPFGLVGAHGYAIVEASADPEATRSVAFVPRAAVGEGLSG